MLSRLPNEIAIEMMSELDSNSFTDGFIREISPDDRRQDLQEGEVLSSIKGSSEKEKYSREHEKSLILGRLTYDGLVSMFYSSGLPWRGTTIFRCTQISNRMMPLVPLFILQTRESHDTKKPERRHTNERRKDTRYMHALHQRVTRRSKS
ncbi:hypothetical protein SCHPADRAFT_103094 [Schizopora paradoxa]|uniref:Uncharacterized protein n=1 Tax=Schizopora paradoxa TaxID=27342 RepID=A0A0H2S3I1_9AGAM|nr:hypothetical protein SCHPADRAFT_103094 [Schizopora paradoxa]